MSPNFRKGSLSNVILGMKEILARAKCQSALASDIRVFDGIASEESAGHAECREDDLLLIEK